MMQYATIDEAWSTSTPPVRYPPDNSFQVGRNDGTQLDSNFCRPGVTLESAYPSPRAEEYERLYGSRSEKRLEGHSTQDPGCQGTPATSSETPETMYGRMYGQTSAHIAQLDPTAISGAHGSRTDSNATTATNTNTNARTQRLGLNKLDTRYLDTSSTLSKLSPPSYNTREASERGRLYDILIFILFGLLVLLAMHEIAALGESVGRARAFSASLARRAHTQMHAPTIPLGFR